MSDILIKDMKLPKSCPCELVGVGYDMYCTFAYGVPSRVLEYYECCEKETRPDWCPITEVPKHGRLIEDEPIIKYITDGLNSGKFGYDAIEVLTEIKYAPTIIPAEEGET